jgi:hypothetical protein
MMTKEDIHKSFWRFIPVGVVLTLLLQAFVWIWWVAAFAATTTARLDALEQRQLAMQQVPERLASLSTKVDGVSEQLVELRVLILKTHIKEMGQ